MGEIASFDKAKLKKTETQEKNTLPTKESECTPASGSACPQPSPPPALSENPAPPPPDHGAGSLRPRPPFCSTKRMSSQPQASFFRPRPRGFLGWGVARCPHPPVPPAFSLQPLSRRSGVKFPKNLEDSPPPSSSRHPSRDVEEEEPPARWTRATSCTVNPGTPCRRHRPAGL